MEFFLKTRLEGLVEVADGTIFIIPNFFEQIGLDKQMFYDDLSVDRNINDKNADYRYMVYQYTYMYRGNPLARDFFLCFVNLRTDENIPKYWYVFRFI